MKARLYMMVQDPRFAPFAGGRRLIEGYDVSGVAFADGPATDCIRVVDIHANSDACEPGVRLLSPRPGRKLAKFDLPPVEQIDIRSNAFNQVSVAATVLKTMALYEDADVLGRRAAWNFDDPQLTIAPRFMLEENARYSRKDKRLVFGYFPSHKNAADTVYTSLSRDIVAHETGHAILDGIAPHLIDAATRTLPSLALHEAIADLTGLLIAISSGRLRLDVLAKTQGSIDHANSFSSLAEQFGMAQGDGPLRELCNEATMQNVNRGEWHDLSKVLTGALYALLIKMHNKCWHAACLPADSAAQRYSKSGKALWKSSRRLARMTLRALDYLAPGRITFADYARAVIAADQASHPHDAEERAWLVEELVRRNVVAHAGALAVPPPDLDLGPVDLSALQADDHLAYEFAAAHRLQLHIPAGRDFTVGPRRKVTKKYYHRSAEGATPTSDVTELLFKVWWAEPEGSEQLLGTTLAIEWDSRRPRVLLTSDRAARPEEEAALNADLRLLECAGLPLDC